MKDWITFISKWQLATVLVFGCWSVSGLGQALRQQVVTLDHVTSADVSQPAGTVTLAETPYGLLITPHLTGLLPGIHGFHIHVNPSCKSAIQDGQPIAALGAGGHFDPNNTGMHLGPYAEGHLGDLPALYVDAQGQADYPVLAPRIKSLEVIQGRSLMIHSGGDNHSDHPKPLGGGGGRVACGVIALSSGL